MITEIGLAFASLNCRMGTGTAPAQPQRGGRPGLMSTAARLAWLLLLTPQGDSG